MNDTPDTTPDDGSAPGTDDWSPGRLDELAPQVDTAAARAVLENARRRRRTGRRLAVGAAAAVIVMGLIGAVALDDDRSAEVATVPPHGDDPAASSTTDTTTTDTTTASTTTSTSPFVGRTEQALRETYPVVRTLFRDGRAVDGGYDLVPGRISITVDGGIVTAAGVECPETMKLAGWAFQACNPGPDDGPTVWGKLIPGDAGELRLEPGFNADRYYEGLLIGPSNTGRAPVHDMSGAEVAVGDLRAEDVVYLWMHDGCRESAPVQCTINAIVVDRS